MIIAGIDYSLTSPAISILDFSDGSAALWENCQSFFLTDMKKTHGGYGGLAGCKFLEGNPMLPFSSDQERYNNIAHWAHDVLKSHKVEYAFIEDYSYGSTGRVFHIAENGGVLKHVLHHSGIKFETIPPTVIKKHATGKGNASKEMMEEAFYKETLIDLRGVLGLTPKQNNPISDIIDSYYILKTGYVTLLEKETHERADTGS